MRAPCLHAVALLAPFLAVVFTVIFDCLSGAGFQTVMIVVGELFSMAGCKGESSSFASTHDAANALYCV